MPAILGSFFMRFLPWILAALLVIGGVIYVRHLQDQVTSAHRQVAAAQAAIDRLTAVNRQNLAALRRVEAENAAWQTTLTTTLAGDDAISRFTDGLLATVAAAPATDDAPVAAVLAGTLAAIAKAQGTVR